jgi:hypothetical protein
MIWSLLMKVDNTTLQNILKNYGKEMKPHKARPKTQKQDSTNQNTSSQKLDSEDLDIINYDKEGKVSIDSQKKDALIDFFQ